MTTRPLPMPADRPTRRANALPSWVVCPPGPLFWIGTAVAILLALDANTLRSFGGLIVALQAWGVVAFVWLGRFVAALAVNHLRLPVRVWLRWIAVPAVLAFVFVLCRTDIPYDVRLALSRAAMDQAAAEVMAGGSSEPRWIGLYPAESVERIPDGMRFLIDGAGFINGVGFAYSANGSRPADVDGSSLYQRIDGDWWLWIAEF